MNWKGVRGRIPCMRGAFAFEVVQGSPLFQKWVGEY